MRLIQNTLVKSVVNVDVFQKIAEKPNISLDVRHVN